MDNDYYKLALNFLKHMNYNLNESEIIAQYIEFGGITCFDCSLCFVKKIDENVMQFIDVSMYGGDFYDMIKKENATHLIQDRIDFDNILFSYEITNVSCFDSVDGLSISYMIHRFRQDDCRYRNEEFDEWLELHEINSTISKWALQCTIDEEKQASEISNTNHSIAKLKYLRLYYDML